jgi:hypothetical protein
MTGRTAVCVLMAIFATSLAAAPAAGQDRAARDLPDDLWNAPEQRAAPAVEDDGGTPTSTLLLTLLALGAAAVGGFLATGVRVPAAPAPPPPPRAPRSRAPRFQGCSISLVRSSSTSEFRVVVGKGPERRVVGRSQRFPAPRTGPLPDEGPARAAFNELTGRLEAVGWLVVGSESDVWHRVQLVRPRTSEAASPAEQAFVDAFGDGFAAFALDDYGNRLRLATRAVGIDQSPEDAHAELVAELEADGWEVAGEGDAWFATTLTRRGLALVP